MMRLRGGKTDVENVASATPSVEGSTAAASAVGVDKFADVAFDVGLLQGSDHESTFPGAVRRGLPVL